MVKRMLSFLWGLMVGISILQTIHYPVAVSEDGANIVDGWSFFCYSVIIVSFVTIFMFALKHIVEHWDDK